MDKLLITGATGNVGIAVMRSLQKLDHRLSIVAGVRDVEKDSVILSPFSVLVVQFDFTDCATYAQALSDCSILFLLRPPQISDVAKYFVPLIAEARKANVRHIVFLSVQGVEKSRIIPHHKIERLIVESKLPYTFLRPAYFMQNFTTTLRDDLVKNKRIFLPAGDAAFTLVDVRDIGAVAARIISEPTRHRGMRYELTSNEKLTFREMAKKLSDGLGVFIRYESPNLLSFYREKRKELVPKALILVMIMLHYLPRFQKEPAITNSVEELTGVKPTSFDDFIRDNKALLT